MSYSRLWTALSRALLVAILAASVPSAAALGQSDEEAPAAMTRRIPAQIDAAALPLYPDASGNTTSEIWSDFGEERWVRNVDRPTLLPLLPDPARANGAAILLIPGGGFQFVSIDNEGYRIADRLLDAGYTVFLLKYRTMTTPQAEADFSAYMQTLWSGQTPIDGFDLAEGRARAIADARTAWSMMLAGDWEIDPSRSGVLGFSAGAVTALGLTLEDTDIAPAFLGYIYGPMSVPDLPQAPPPLFSALAADDTLFAGQGFQLIEDWQASGAPVEFHYYESGGHGFGSYQRGTPADHWLTHFSRWLEARGVSGD